VEKNSHSKIISFLLLLTGVVQCGLTSTGPVLLKENFGARAFGMGDAYVALGRDAFGMQYNPALLSYVPGSTISALYSGGVADNYSGYIGFVSASKYDIAYGKTKGLAFGFNISTLQGGNMEINNNDGTTNTVNSESDILLSVSAAVSLSNPLSVGITGKYFSSTLVGKYSGSALAADAGLIYDLSNIILPDLMLGISLQNIGTKLKYISAEEPLPMTLRVGLGHKCVLEDRSVLSTGVEVDNIIGERAFFNFGVEYFFQDSLFLRAGYKAGYDLGGLTLGLGFKYDSLQIDYGMGFLGEFNGSYGKISLSYYFDSFEQSYSRKTKVTPKRILR